MPGNKYFTILVALFGSSAYSEEIKLSTPKIEKTYQEQKYYFSIQEYTPPLTFDNEYANKYSSDSPEYFLMKHIEAMVNGNYTEYLNHWDDDSIKFMKQLDFEMGRTEKTWVSIWSETFKDKKVKLTHKLSTGVYLILAFNLEDTKGDASKNMRFQVAMKKINESGI